jgi:hypothetical protein
MAAEAVQIVEIEEDENVFRLNEEGLAAVLARVPPDSKVAVVAVAGAFRTGKSFLLDLFLRYLRAGTDVATTVRAGRALCECKCCPALHSPAAEPRCPSRCASLTHGPTSSCAGRLDAGQRQILGG